MVSPITATVSLIILHRDCIAHLDGTTVIHGGWLNHHWVQLGYQIADSLAGGIYSFVGTCLILACLEFIGNYLPALKLRVSEEDEIMGIDDVEIGEFAVSAHSSCMVRTALILRSTITSSSLEKSKSLTTSPSRKNRPTNPRWWRRMRRRMTQLAITSLNSSQMGPMFIRDVLQLALGETHDTLDSMAWTSWYLCSVLHEIHACSNGSVMMCWVSRFHEARAPGAQVTQLPSCVSRDLVGCRALEPRPS